MRPTTTWQGMEWCLSWEAKINIRRSAGISKDSTFGVNRRKQHNKMGVGCLSILWCLNSQKLGFYYSVYFYVTRQIRFKQMLSLIHLFTLRWSEMKLLTMGKRQTKPEISLIGLILVMAEYHRPKMRRMWREWLAYISPCSCGHFLPNVSVNNSLHSAHLGSWVLESSADSLASEGIILFQPKWVFEKVKGINNSCQDPKKNISLFFGS